MKHRLFETKNSLQEVQEMSAKKVVEKLLSQGGIHINGTNNYDIQVHDKRFFSSVIKNGQLGPGESYMKGWWECPALDELVNRIIRAGVLSRVELSIPDLFRAIPHKVCNFQSRSRAFQVAQHHYDLGNDLFQTMLDKRLVYSCGYWKDTDSLDTAQEQKLDLLCRKLHLKEGMKVLDIGCGFGSFAKYAAEKYGVSVDGITVSQEQAGYAREYCKGLPVHIHVMDYREMSETYDAIVSVGMFEHVGEKNYKTFFKTVHNCLAPDGIFVLHTIGGNKTTSRSHRWISKYIFPNGKIPSIKQIAQTAEPFFVMEDWHNFGPDYDTTLMAWKRNFEAGWPALKERYGDTFYRMWIFYLASCAGAFRARELQVWQIVYTHPGKEKLEYRCLM